MPSSASEFDNHFQRFQRRILWLLGEKLVCLGLAGASVVALALCIVTLFGAWYVTPAGLVLIGVLGIAAGIAYLLRRRPTRRQLAITIEGRHPFQDSLRTAVALQEAPGAAEDEFAPRVLADAARALGAVTPQGLFPRRYARHHSLALCGWLLVIFFYLLPAIGWLHSPAQRLERAQVRQAGEHLVQLASALANRPEIKRSPQARQALRKLQQLAREMQQNHLSKLESLKRLNQLADELAQAAPDAQAGAGQDAGGAEHGGSPGGKNDANGQGKDASALQSDMAQANDGLADAQSEMNDNGGQQEAANGSPGGDSAGGQQGNGAAGDSGTGNGQAGGNQAGQGNGKDGGNQAGQGSGKSGGTQPGNGNGAGAGNQAGNGNGGGAGNQAGNGNGNGNGKGSGNQPGNGSGNGQGSGSGKGSGNGNGNGGANGQGAGGQGGGHGNEHQHGNGNNRSNGGGGEGGTGGGGVGSGGMMSAPGADPHAGYTRQHTSAMLSAGASISVPRETHGGVGTPGQPSSVPYSSVYADYRKRAEHALDDDQVPPEERARVKAYFDALNPGK